MNSKEILQEKILLALQGKLNESEDEDLKIYDNIDWNKYITNVQDVKNIEEWVKQKDYPKLIMYIINLREKFEIDLSEYEVESIVNQLVEFVKLGNLKNATIYKDKKEVEYINIKDLNCRKLYKPEDRKKIDRLKKIISNELIHLAPLLVEWKDNKYEITDGAHRYYAYKELNFDKVPVIIE